MTGPVFLVGPDPALSPVTGGFPALLCDRDGTIMADRRGYVREWAQIELYQGAVRALRQVSRTGAPIIFVTNQPAIGKGVLTLDEAVTLHHRVVDSLSAVGVRVAGTYMCPHTATDACGCRKPAPGMIRAALARFRLDPARTVFVGDAVDDMLAARHAGVPGVLVRTGRGADSATRFSAVLEEARSPVVPDLSAAVELLGQLFPGRPGARAEVSGAARGR